MEEPKKEFNLEEELRKRRPIDWEDIASISNEIRSIDHEDGYTTFWLRLKGCKKGGCIGLFKTMMLKNGGIEESLRNNLTVAFDKFFLEVQNRSSRPN